MNYNYHTHTFRCNHAVGSEEEYIERAIAHGIKYMGFSEHFPFKIEGYEESKYRMSVMLVADYIETIRQLKEKYKQQIELKVGFEMEYYPDSFNHMLKKAIEYGAEYLILGQHFLREEYFGGRYTGTNTENIQDLKDYVSLVIQGMETGVFSYVAHPDVLNFLGDIEIYKKEMRKICISSKKLNVPLEINFLGIRYNRHYPLDVFWEIAGQVGCPVTFGCDAHDVIGAFDESLFEKAKALLERYHLNYIGKPKLKKITNKKGVSF